MTMTIQDTWRTDDLYVAAYLISEGHDPKGVERDGRHSFVLFDAENRNELAAKQRAFYRTSVPVNFPSFRASLRELKEELRYA